MTAGEKLIASSNSWPNGLYEKGDTAELLEDKKYSYVVRFTSGKYSGRSGEVYKENWRVQRCPPQ